VLGQELEKKNQLRKKKQERNLGKRGPPDVFLRRVEGNLSYKVASRLSRSECWGKGEKENGRLGGKYLFLWAFPLKDLGEGKMGDENVASSGMDPTGEWCGGDKSPKGSSSGEVGNRKKEDKEVTTKK